MFQSIFNILQATSTCSDSCSNSFFNTTLPPIIIDILRNGSLQYKLVTFQTQPLYMPTSSPTPSSDISDSKRSNMAFHRHGHFTEACQNFHSIRPEKIQHFKPFHCLKYVRKERDPKSFMTWIPMRIGAWSNMTQQGNYINSWVNLYMAPKWDHKKLGFPPWHVSMPRNKPLLDSPNHFDSLNISWV